MNSISQKMADCFAGKDAQAAADLIAQTKTPTEQTNAMHAADKAGFGVEFYPGGGIRVWVPARTID